MPREQLLAEMGKFNDELVKAGIMPAGEGLQPSSKGVHGFNRIVGSRDDATKRLNSKACW